jgi:hypothetical protein
VAAEAFSIRDPEPVGDMQFMRRFAFLALLPVLAGCGTPNPADKEAGRQRYLTARDECATRFRNSLVAQSDCRARAANLYIRPFYKYSDLMNRAQSQRRALAEEADDHHITRSSYERQVARSEAAISREEDRRNRLANSGGSGPFARLVDGVADFFR